MNEGEQSFKQESLFSLVRQEPRIKIVSPVSGIVKTIERGPKRKIERIIIEANEGGEARTHSG